MEDKKSDNTELVNPEGETMDQNTALNILVNAVHIGQSRGAWKLEETEVLLRAIKAFTVKK